MAERRFRADSEGLMSTKEIPGREDEPAGRSRPLSMAPDPDGRSFLFRSIPVAVMAADASTGQVLEMNDACLDLFGTTRESVIGRTLVEAGLSFVVDLGRQGRSLKSVEATVVDSAGARVVCRLYTASVLIDGSRAVISVLLDSQMEKAVRGGRKSETQARKGQGPVAQKPLALLVTLGDAPEGSSGEMLQLLGFDLVTESTARMVLELAPLGRPAGVAVIDSPRDQSEADACLAEIVRTCPKCRAVVIADAGSGVRFPGGGAAVLYKPVSINDLADSLNSAQQN